MSGESRGHILPVGAELLDSQVAGHRFGASKTKLGLLRHSESGDILKPIHDKRSNREHQFYETIFDTANDNDECTVRLRNLVPRFKGLFEDIRTNRKYIRLDSATKTMLHPSLLDAKIGAITYDPEASEVKKHSELNKYRYAKDLGFRILGMKVRNFTKFHFLNSHPLDLRSCDQYLHHQIQRIWPNSHTGQCL